MDFTEATISQNYYWPNPRGKNQTRIKVCKTCHKNKQQNKYGHLPTNESEAIPWNMLLV